MRIAPNHVSTAGLAAFRAISARGTRGLKGHFYDATVSTGPKTGPGIQDGLSHPLPQERVVLESRECGAGSSSRRDEGGSSSGRVTPTETMAPGLDPRPWEEHGCKPGMGGVSRHLYWYPSCISFVMRANARTQDSIGLTGSERKANKSTPGQYFPWLAHPRIHPNAPYPCDVCSHQEV